MDHDTRDDETRPRDDLELAFHRALERRAGEDDWLRIERAAAHEPDVYRELAERLRDECRLAGLAELSNVAESIELPVVEPATGRVRRGHVATERLGWLAAAVLLLALVTRLLQDAAPRADLASDRFAGAGATPRPIPQQLTELPRLLVDARRDGDDYRLVYVKRTVEAVRVPTLYGVATDDSGRAASIAIPDSAFVPLEEL
jgi:hypothetical protein